MNVETRHCCTLNAGSFGILIEGPSGSGKTSLMFGLLERLEKIGIPAQLVSDDYTRLEANESSIIGTAPENISNQAEIRGYGIVAVDAVERSAPIGLVVRLTEDQEIERMPERKTVNIMGHSLNAIDVPARHETGALRIVLAWLRDNSPLSLPRIGS